MTNFKEDANRKDDIDEVTILESPEAQNKSKEISPTSVENKYYSLMSILSKMGIRELVCGLCDYIKSINCPQTLE